MVQPTLLRRGKGVGGGEATGGEESEPRPRNRVFALPDVPDVRDRHAPGHLNHLGGHCQGTPSTMVAALVNLPLYRAGSSGERTPVRRADHGGVVGVRRGHAKVCELDVAVLGRENVGALGTSRPQRRWTQHNAVLVSRCVATSTLKMRAGAGRPTLMSR